MVIHGITKKVDLPLLNINVPAKAKTQTAGKNADPNAVSGQAAKPIQMSQQDRMRMCSKQATGKKGAERKTFMKSCLTTRKS